MPWRKVNPMDEKIRLIADYRSGLYSVAELCHRHGISRKTGHKWINRYALIPPKLESLSNFVRQPIFYGGCRRAHFYSLLQKDKPLSR